jgi:hypothetical protein
MSEAIYCFDTASVRFAIYPDGVRFVAAISEDPLRDLFGASEGGESLVQAYLDNADIINATALERHRLSNGRPVALETADFEMSAHEIC